MPTARQQNLDQLHDTAREAIQALDSQISHLVEEVNRLEHELEESRSQIQSEREERDILYSLESGSADVARDPNTDNLRQKEAQLTDDAFRARTLSRGLHNFSSILAASIRQLNEHHELPTMDSATQVAIRMAEVRVREAEGRRFAREIHDGPAQAFANAIIGLEFVERALRKSNGDDMSEEALSEIERIKRTMREGLTEIRRFIFDYRPTMLDDRGLVPTIKHYVANYHSIFPMKVELEVEDDLPRLTPEQELTAFRTIQESLQNVSKHARASRAQISIKYDDGDVRIDIVDDGRGFDPDEVSAHSMGGTGLTGMRERSDLIGAVLTIDSASGEGTKIRLRVPVTSS